MDEGQERDGRRSGKRRHWSIEEKRKLVEEALSSSGSVAYLARQRGVNANQLFGWRKLYLAGQLEVGTPTLSSLRLLPVAVTEEEQPGEPAGQALAGSPNVTINIELPGRALVSVEGQVDAEIIRAVLESLRG